MATYRVQQWSTFSRLWWIYDLNHQCPFKSARLIAKYLAGKHKPIYHPKSYVGDQVVVINTKHMSMEGELWRTYKIFNHTGYPRGFSQTRAFRVHDEDPTMLMKKIVYSNIKGTLMRKSMMQRLHLYPDENVPKEIFQNVTCQIPQLREVPKKLSDYTAEEIRKFPKLFDL